MTTWRQYRGLRDAEVRETKGRVYSRGCLGDSNSRGDETTLPNILRVYINILADGISRWPRSILADKVREQTNSSDWYEQKVGTRGSGIFDIVLQAKNIRSQDDDML